MRPTITDHSNPIPSSVVNRYRFWADPAKPICLLFRAVSVNYTSTAYPVIPRERSLSPLIRVTCTGNLLDADDLLVRVPIPFSISDNPRRGSFQTWLLCVEQTFYCYYRNKTTIIHKSINIFSLVRFFFFENHVNLCLVAKKKSLLSLDKIAL